MLAEVEIYTSPFCGFCHRAKHLLDQKGVAYKEIDVFQVPGAKEEMISRSGRRTVPQIFIDGAGVGGCDEIHALERQGKLDSLLNA